ncbi:rRNA pseudouridine synthase [Sulfurimonas sp. MAG313]|nr:pseudouridine synthase [Sulfurimonas sp. MAG313]MDF1879751.1 rRNA pseudouridine synthase [Sulfurimonas sp. MAG313]
MRLNKFIAHHSTYSRREADAAILKGAVKIKGKVETNPATDVDERHGEVHVHGKKVSPKDIITVIAYNKRKGELVTKDDPRGRTTIYDTLGHKFRHFISVGRLDYASEGLLLLTDSSVVATVLMNSDLERIYKIKIKGKVTQPMEDAMRKGITVSDASAGGHELSAVTEMTFSPFSAYRIEKNNENYSILKVGITEGKNRELRRFFAHFGAEVADLKRISYGGVELNNLPDGKSRFLSRSEYTSVREYVDSVTKTDAQRENFKLRKIEKEEKEKAQQASDAQRLKAYEDDKDKLKRIEKVKNKIQGALKEDKSWDDYYHDDDED